MLGTLAVPTQLVSQGLTTILAGSAYELKFAEKVPEQPYLDQVYEINSVALRVLHRVTLGVPQPEAFPSPLTAQLLLYRGAELIAVWPLEFQMRAVAATEGKEWVGEASVFQNLTTPIEYSAGQTLSFAVAGIVPGQIAGPTPTKPLPVEIEGQPVAVQTQEPIRIQEPVQVEVVE